ncbi:MAG: T9SS type A sorting domain-containing protein, partial [Bacteroidales bacterium]|nr:T9SS type A sorting domain-containing protein [Bacteroidales bacterium]
FSDMENYGLSFPFNVCFSFEPYGQDPNLDNNIACAEITDIDLVPTTTKTLNFFPKPANTYINVENAAGSQISVYNIAGQEVLSVESDEANETINVSNLNAGLYIVRMVNGNEVSTAKVSIIR